MSGFLNHGRLDQPPGLGCRVLGVWDSGSRDVGFWGFRDLEFRDLGLRDLGVSVLGVWDSGFSYLGFRVLGLRDLGFRVEALAPQTFEGAMTMLCSFEAPSPCQNPAACQGC